MCYQAIALRDIDVGDEITCDYALFDYDCSGHQIEVCACGSTKCRGKMTGFQGKASYFGAEITHIASPPHLDPYILFWFARIATTSQGWTS